MNLTGLMWVNKMRNAIYTLVVSFMQFNLCTYVCVYVCKNTTVEVHLKPSETV